MKTHLNLDKKTFIVELPGDLLSTNAAAVRSNLNEILDAEPGKSFPWDIFRLELPAAKMVDSVGLNLIVSILRIVQKSNRRLQVTYGNPNVLRTFQFTRLDQHVELINQSPSGAA